MNLLALIGLGFFLGIRHATDADHVVAVTAIASRSRGIWQAAGVAALWGVGHTLTIFVVGAAIIMFSIVVPPRVGLSLEFAVGIALAVVGCLNVAGKRGFMTSGADDGAVPRLRAFVVGLVHGLAGSAAAALLVLATVRDPRAAVAYLRVFGFGTVLGMMLVTVAFAVPTSLAARRFGFATLGIRLSTGLLSAALGLWVMYQVGFVDGLFLAAPHWVPR